MTVNWLAAAVAIPIAGLLGQRLSEARDRKRFRVPGRLIDVDGTAIHVVTQGAGPAVLIDSGLGGSSLEWAAVAADLSRDFTVVRYDRPGFGWSPPASGDSSPLAAAQRICGIVSTLELPRPLVLVGHSLGGVHVRLAASLYPDTVGGLVLVDPSHEDMLDTRDASRSAAVTATVAKVIAAIAPFGAARVAGRLYARMVVGQIRRDPDAAGREVLRTSMLLTACSVHGLRAAVAELTGLPASLRQAKELGQRFPLPAIPVTVISANAPARTAAEQTGRATIRALHEAQVASTSLGRLVLAANSGHLVPLDEPELIATCVRETAAVAKGNRDVPLDAPAQPEVRIERVVR